MYCMFNRCSSLSDITTLANWNVSNVLDMNSLIAHTAVSDVSALANWNTSSVTDVRYMFYECYNIA